MLIKKPENFSFKTTVYSHGWYQLAPFALDEKAWKLESVFRITERNRPVRVRVSETEKNIKIEFSGDGPDEIAKDEIARDVRRVLRIDEDLSEFYELVENTEDFAWIAERRAGRLLRSPSVFEDLVKTVCTTNCSWSLTKKMVAGLVEKLGEECAGEDEKTAAGGGRAFPTPGAMAEADAGFYRSEIHSGYRSEYLAELARRVASGEIEPEKWLTSDLPTAELKKEIKKIKGVGDYAAENLLKLLGRYDGLALDSFLRAEFYKNYNGGNPCPDGEIEKFYEPFGAWRGLVMWFDMSRRWLA